MNVKIREENLYMECFIMSGNQINVTKDKLWISLLGVICAICLVLVFLITAIEAVVDLHGEEHTQYGKIAKE